MARRKASLADVPAFSSIEKEVAWRAIGKFGEMRPQLTQFARSITGNQKVEIHATHEGPYTRGNKIFLRPPMALGRNYAHERNLCGSRGDDGRQSCAACRAREVVNFYLFHEIGHIWLGTQDAVTWDDKRIAQDHVNEWHPEGACYHAQDIMRVVNEQIEVMGIGTNINPYLGGFINALEDARINEGMFDARPGLRQIFDVNIERLMSEGIEHDLGEMKLWKDAPADAQFSVALSIRAYGYEIGDYFHPDIVAAISDERIEAICEGARYASSVHDILHLALRAFVVAQELGFCVVPKCEVPPPADPTDPNQEDKDEDESDGNPEEGDGGSSPSGGGGVGEGSGENNADTSSGRSNGTGSSGTEGEDSSSEKMDSNTSRSGISGNTEPAGSSGGSTDPNAGEANQAKPAGSQGDGGQEESDGPSDLPQDDGGLPDDGDRQSEDEGQSSVPSANEDGAGELPADISGGTANGTDVPAEGGDDDRGTQNGTEHQDGDVDNDSESAGEVALSDPDDDADPAESTDPWDVKSPDSDGPLDVGARTPLPESVGPEGVMEALAPFLMHGLNEIAGMIEDMLGEDMEGILADVEVGTGEFDRTTALIAIALSQVLFFDDPSISVAGVDVAKFPSPGIKWRQGVDWNTFMPDEGLLGQAVQHARRVFEDNKRSHLEPNRKSGKIRPGVLGRRAPLGDERLFGKKVIPKKRSYLVIIAGDCSASTNSYNRNEKIKRMMFAQAEILHRVGVPFAMLGHSASDAKIKDFHKQDHDDYWMYVLPIKEEGERWTNIQRERLAGMHPISENLDGHALQYCRKLADKSSATDVIIIYYTDGEMPASNGTEEKAILIRELKLCKQKKYHTLAVGIETNSPARYGMKTVRADSDDDIKLVIKQLEEELTHI